MMSEQDIWDAWIRDDSGNMDLCKYCVHDLSHKIGAVCTGFIWNGKEISQAEGQQRL